MNLIINTQTNIAHASDIKLICELLQQTTTIAVVKDFLKTKELHFSAASWDELYEKRILPAVIDGLITNVDLINLLKSVEEYGRQHTFLFKCAPEKVLSLMDMSRVKEILQTKGIEDILVTPRILDQPDNPTIVDVRLDQDGNKRTLTCKLIEQRRYERFVEDVQDGDYLLKKYETVKQRAVNIVSLHSDGLLEIRITSHSNSSDYKSDLRRLWALSLLFNKGDFSEVSFAPAKQRLWGEQKEFAAYIRFSNSTLRNDQGNILNASTGSVDADLLEDDGVVESLHRFISHEAYCEALNIWFKASEELPKDVHVRIAGEVNEFAVPAHCTKPDYEFVLEQLTKFNS